MQSEDIVLSKVIKPDSISNLSIWWKQQKECQNKYVIKKCHISQFPSSQMHANPNPGHCLMSYSKGFFMSSPKLAKKDTYGCIETAGKRRSTDGLIGICLPVNLNFLLIMTDIKIN
jgi:hypothetical protein